MPTLREKLARFRVRVPAAWIVLAVGIALSTLAWHAARSHVEGQAHAKFVAEISAVKSDIEIRLGGHHDILYGIQGLISASRQIDREAFHRYVFSLGLSYRYSELRSVSYAQHVPAALKQEFEKRMREEYPRSAGLQTRFTIKPPGDREDYVVLAYIEPLIGNERGLGLDLVADAVRRASVERARDTLMPSASERFTLVSEPSQVRGAISLRLAVYRRNLPTETVDQRRRAFMGVASVTFLVRDLVRDILANTHAGQLSIGIRDITSGREIRNAVSSGADTPIYSNLPATLGRDMISGSVTIEVGGRLWQLEFAAPRSIYIDPADHYMPWGTFFAGLVISVLLSGLVRSLATSGERALALADQITADLRRSEAELMEAQRMTQEMIEALPNPIFFKDTSGRYLGVNKAWEKYFGIPRKAFVGKTVHDLYPHSPQVADRLHAMDQELWNRPGTQTYEAPITTPDGALHDTIYYKATYARADGKVAGLIGTIIDISDRKKLEQLFQSTFEQAAVGIAHFDLEQRILMVNRRYGEIVGYTPEELLGKAPIIFNHPDDAGIGSVQRDKLLSGEIDHFSQDKRYVRKDGSTIWVRRTESLARDAAGEPAYFIRVIEDITERKLAESHQVMEHAVTAVLAEAESLSSAIPRIIQTICETMGWDCGSRWEWDKTAGLLRCREAWGVDTPEIAEFVAAGADRAVPPIPIGDGLVRRTFATRSAVWIADIARDKGFFRRELAARAGLRCGFAFPLLVGNEIRGVMDFFLRDVREPDATLIRISESLGRQIGQYLVRMQAEEAVKFVATHDALTALPNRIMFNQRLEHAIAQVERHGRRLAVLFIDLDRFKVINDTLGHEAGDTLLREVAARLTDTLRTSDTVARLGGDEFVVLVEEVLDPSMLGNLAQKLIAALARSFLISERECHVTASIGISTHPDDSTDAQTLLKNADIAMYRAKEQGRNTFQFYSAQMNVHTIERLSLESALRRAVERDELILHYQPQINLRTGRITGVEALVRWHHPDLGLLPPAKFIPLAEETGLIVPIGEWVLRTACVTHAGWKRQGLPHVKIAVNLSARQFVHENLLQDLMRVLEQTACEPDCLELELTESMVMQSPERAVTLLQQMKETGMRLAIDDFGTGYSSLAQLKRFPIDCVKIDRSFVNDVPSDSGNTAITKAVIAMAHSLGLVVIAEGVETREQFDFLRKNRCDEMQGYYFSRPIAGEQLEDLLRKGSTPATRAV